MSRSSAWPKTGRPVVTGASQMVVSGHHLASLAGHTMLEAGGNAVDAAIAAALATNVVQSELTSIGGIAPNVIYLAEQNRVVNVVGTGYWPRRATTEYFIKNHDGTIPRGVLESPVPACIDTYITCLRNFGTMSFADVAAPAIRYAEEGFVMYPLFIEIVNWQEPAWPSTAAIYRPGGKSPEVGQLFVQKDLAATLRYLADEDRAASGNGREAGLDAARTAFYKGDVARQIHTFYAENGGLLDYDDLATYEGGIREPISSRFAGYDVYSERMDGVHLLEAMNILEAYDLRGMGHNSAEYVHTVTEALKLAFSDRFAYVGDPDFLSHDLKTLITKEYAAYRRKSIDPDKAWPDMPPAGALDFDAAALSAEKGTPSAEDTFRQNCSTSYLCTMDKAGNSVSMIVSGANVFTPSIPGLGFGIGHFGKCGWADLSNPNFIAPGKRTRIAAPALAIKPGEHVIPFGSPGSDVIPQAMLQVFFNMAVFGMNPQQAVEQPRFATYSHPALFYPHHYVPGEMWIEESLHEKVGSELAAKGHVMEVWPERDWRSASVCTIRRDVATGLMNGGADPRRDAYAIGW